MAFALCWYYLAFHLAAKAVSPLIVVLDTERTTILGHATYGALLARFLVYLPHAAEPPVASAPEPESPDAQPPAPEVLPA